MHLQASTTTWKRGTRRGQGKVPRVLGRGRTHHRPAVRLALPPGLLRQALAPGVLGTPPDLSQLFSPLHRTPSLFLGTTSVPSHPPVSDDDATRQGCRSC